MYWYQLKDVLYVADYVVTDLTSMTVIRTMKIPNNIQDRYICPDDAVYNKYSIDYFINNWFAIHPDIDEIPQQDMDNCDKKEEDMYNRVPINNLGDTCYDKALLVSLAFDIDRLGSLEQVIKNKELNEYYQKKFIGK